MRTTPINTNKGNIAEKAMLVTLSISQWTARKFDKKATEEVETAFKTGNKAGRFNKLLIAKDAIKTIEQKAAAARDYHYTVTLPWNDNGARILPSALYFDYTNKMREFQNAFNDAVAKLLTNYPALVTEAQNFLGDLYNAMDYPTEERLAKKYGFSVDVFPIPCADDFRVSLQNEEVNSIKQQIEERTAALIENTKQDIYTRLISVVEKAVEKLSTPDAIFRDSLIENIVDLTDLIPALNITGDKKLARITKAIENTLCQIDPQEVRDNKEARKEAAEEAKELLETLNDYADIF